ncbi:MAG: hypothetical protein JZU55_16665 [Afipia sp.]|nr:hypothetical protein [Afipia sp.]
MNALDIGGEQENLRRGRHDPDATAGRAAFVARENRQPFGLDGDIALEQIEGLRRHRIDQIGAATACRENPPETVMHDPEEGSGLCSL